jgi:1-acyl-sn-glycerol-3-phosphate acyltransferase
MMHLHFRSVSLKGEFHDLGLPVLMIGNHFSWWDGFIAYFINFRLLHRKFHVMMLEEQLMGRKFLNKTGAFSIKRGGRSVIESLHYSAELLRKKGNLVVLYPQGEFQSLYARSIDFEKGIRIIASKIDSSIHLLFYAALLDYFSQRKPTLVVYIAEMPQEIASDPARLEQEYNRFLERCILQQKPD